MPDDRLLRILSRLQRPAGDDPSTTRLCVVSAEVTQMTGAGIMLMRNGEPQGSFCTTDHVSSVIEELQFTLGEGPCVDAHRHHRPVIEPDLVEPAEIRWMAFAPPAVAAGARAVFGFPITFSDVPLGALNLYRDRPGAMTDDQRADAEVLAGIAGRSIIDHLTETGGGAADADGEPGVNLRFAVHQAVGMIAVQLDVPVSDALARLRAHAFSHDRLLIDVAHDVVARRLRFTEDGGNES